MLTLRHSGMICLALGFACSACDGSPDEQVEESESEPNTTSAALGDRSKCTESPCLDITSSNVHVRGGGRVIDCGGLDIGIRIAHRTNVHLNGFEIRNCGTGILIEGGGHHHLARLNVHDSVVTATAFGHGILMIDTRHNRVKATRSSFNAREGVRLFNSHRNELVALTLKGNNGSGGLAACDIINSNENDLRSSEISDNLEYGVLIRKDSAWISLHQRARVTSASVR